MNTGRVMTIESTDRRVVKGVSAEEKSYENYKITEKLDREKSLI